MARCTTGLTGERVRATVNPAAVNRPRVPVNNPLAPGLRSVVSTG